MATVNSVLGPIDTSALGFTLMHEHILLSPAGVSQDYPELLSDRFMERIVNGLTRAKEGGIDTIVDASTLDLGRNVKVLAETSRRTGVNIIACTGWWLEKPRFLAGVSADQFAQLFIREIREGIAGTGIKAGILKAASDIEGVTPQEETILRGVARAHRRTNLPIMLHSYSPGQVGRQQLAILKQEGVDPKRVKMDHSNDTTDLEYLFWLLEQGCYLGLDRYPGWNTSPLARTKTMKALIDAGYADRLCPSHDWTLARIAPDISSMSPEEIHRQAQWSRISIMSQEERDRLNPYGYLYVKDVVFNQLREMGVSEDIINTLCVNGPRNFFEGV